MTSGMGTWIRSPLAILVDDCETGVVFEGGRIVACLARGSTPSRRCDGVVDAFRRVAMAGPDKAHHSCNQTLMLARALDRGPQAR